MGSRSRYRPNRNTDTLSSSPEYPIRVSTPPVPSEPDRVSLIPWGALNAVGDAVRSVLIGITEDAWTPEGAELTREPLAYAIWASRYASRWIWSATGADRGRAERVPRARRELPATCRFWGDVVAVQLRMAYLAPTEMMLQNTLAAGLECCLAVRDVIEKQVPQGSWEFDLTIDRLDEVSPMRTGFAGPIAMIYPYFVFASFVDAGIPEFLAGKEHPAQFCYEMVDAMCKKGLVVRERVA